MYVTRRSLISSLIGLTLLMVVVPPNRVASVLAATGPRTLTGIVPDAVSSGRAQRIGHEPTTNSVRFSVSLSLRNVDALLQFLRDLENPASPRYHRPISLQEANVLFNPTETSQQQVTDWLKSRGLGIVRTYPNHLIVDVQGTVSQVESAFHVTLNLYRATVHGRSQTFYAPGANGVLDGVIGNSVETITGLDSYPRFFHPHANGNANGAAPYYPADFANAYNVNPLWNAGYTGKGQSIGITMWSQPPDDSALNRYTSDTGASIATGTNGRLKVIPVDGGNTVADTGEAGMDIEMSSAMAPDATINYYESPVDSAGNPTDTGLLDALNLAGTDATNNRQITNSWGGCEATSTNDSWTLSAERIFAANTATGHNYFFSAGDSGSWCDGTTPGTFVNPWPDYPASSPNVTSVGGTSFSSSVGNTWPGEVAWPYCASCSAGSPEGSGGGYSAIFGHPSWQTASGVASSTRRGYPDISADADPSTGAYVCYGPDNTACDQIGGTSLASPLWAGMAAIVNQYLGAHGKPYLGFLNPTLYRLATNNQPYAPFHDITSGTNGKYNAHAGWDAVTGLGTPNLWNVARDVAAMSAGSTAGGPTNTPTPTSTPTSPAAPQNLITNGDFENGLTGWESDSRTGSTLLDTSNPHGGSADTLFCGVNRCLDHMSQYITVPANVASATLSYWVQEQSSESAKCSDSFRIRVRNASGLLVQAPAPVCNGTSAWTQRTVSLTSLLGAYAGQKLQVNLLGQTNASQPTTFRVDDVAILVTTGTTAPRPTATPTPTPTKTSTSTGGNSVCPGSGCAQAMLNILNANRSQYSVSDRA
ncbi:MAG: hypothetical protein PVSMB7_24500 [Chloroflexota bacterium]